tara:strand:- start:124 stop:813 length:690 start_codon:yes stop_codon:yes gene_type:complete
MKKEAVDHSKTYTRFSFRNIPHILRLKSLIKYIKTVAQSRKINSYADFGCSNGYITKEVLGILGEVDVYGGDVTDNIYSAKKLIPNGIFEYFDLCNPKDNFRSFDFVTCFETLEHVGNPKIATQTLINLTKEGGTLLISVPIETGISGLMKLFIKLLIYKEDFSLECGRYEYAKKLFLNKRIESLRHPAEFYGPHYGFDWRLIKEFLDKKNIEYTISTKFTTKIFLITK